MLILQAKISWASMFTFFYVEIFCFFYVFTMLTVLFARVDTLLSTFRLPTDSLDNKGEIMH